MGSITTSAQRTSYNVATDYAIFRIRGSYCLSGQYMSLTNTRLNLNFIIGSVTTNLSALLVGSVLDRYGPFPCALISCIVLFLGSLCMAFADVIPFDAYPLGFFLLALGGTFTFVPSFHLSNAFPKLQGTILSLITGAFDASAAVFLGFRLIHEATEGGFGVRQFFLAYLLVPVLMLLATLFLMPRQSYETRAELEAHVERAHDNFADVHDSDDDISSTGEMYRVRSKRAQEREEDASQIVGLIGTQDQQIEHEIQEDEKKITSGVWGVLHGLPARKQMASAWFILIALFTVLQMTRFNFFISTIWSQYEYLLGGRDKATKVTQFFDLVLPLGGVATVPFIGLLLDGTSTVTVLSLLVLMSTLIGVLGAMPDATAAYSNVVLFCIFRPLYYSAVSDYAAKIFGFATFGTVYGTIICLSGLSLFSQPALQALVHDAFYEDPGPVNLYLAGAGLLIGLALVMFVDSKAREIRRNQFQFLAAANAGTMAIDDERRSLLSVSLYNSRLDGAGAAAVSLGRRRSIDLLSPRIRPQDMARIPNLGANLYYNYGSMGANLTAADDTTPTQTPFASLRVRNSRTALGAGLRRVTERDEPEEPDEPRARRKQRQFGETLSPTVTRDESVTSSASRTESRSDNGNRGDDEDLEASQLILEDSRHG